MEINDHRLNTGLVFPVSGYTTNMNNLRIQNNVKFFFVITNKVSRHYFTKPGN